MGFTDTIDNRRKRGKSMKKENKAINQKMDDIEEATAAKEQLLFIGQYFWKKYIAGEYTPDDKNSVYFDNLDRLNEQVKDLNQEIDDLKIAGMREREIIDEDTRIRIRNKEDLKAEKAEAKARAKSGESEEGDF